MCLHVCMRQYIQFNVYVCVYVWMYICMDVCMYADMYLVSFKPILESLLADFWVLIHSFIHSDYFYSAYSSPLLLRGAPDTAQILYLNFVPKCQRQLWVKDLPKVPTLWLERESNLWPLGRKMLTLPMRYHAPPLNDMFICVDEWCSQR